MDREVALREANHRFAEHARAVEAGESFVITRRGRTVARLVPPQAGRRVLTPEQQAARAPGTGTDGAGGSTWASLGSGSIATRCMSAERYSIDTNPLVYAVDLREGDKQLRALDVMERSVELNCVLTGQSLAEFVVVATRRRMLSKPHAIAQARLAVAVRRGGRQHAGTRCCPWGIRSGALRLEGRPPAGDRPRGGLHDPAQRGHAGWCRPRSPYVIRCAAARCRRSAAAARNAIGSAAAPGLQHPLRRALEEQPLRKRERHDAGMTTIIETAAGPIKVGRGAETRLPK